MSTSSAWPSSVRPIDATAAIAATELGGIELALRLSAAQLRRPLEETAIDLGAPGRDPNSGAGRVDAFAAHAAARALAKLEDR